MATYMTMQLVCISVIAFVITAVFAFDRNRDKEIDWKWAEKANATSIFIEDEPYIVSIQNQGTHICSGVIIDKRYILTNARCVEMCQERSLVKNITVLTGTDTFNCSGFTHYVEKIYYHTNYTKKSQYVDGLAHNIAILKLTTNIEFDDFRKRAWMPYFNHNYRYQCNNVTTIGWGRLYRDGPVSSVLQILSSYQSDNTLCEKNYRREFSVSNTDFCVSYGYNAGTCHCDIGSPVICQGFVVGIISVCVPCNVYYPSIATEIHANQRWIRSIIGS
ncbi:PREDICTED: granzyme M-like [Dinoponera quadriceps]|uniref:Granzyme M-like n=1 Tax=Dinoponera quadriceps TaxID=609295 RepID=A0A6P3XIV5_DINQU|nr:PREDICTED: granzyme M-like [Dinoponera quadriceps]